jgi:hypothetical protein
MKLSSPKRLQNFTAETAQSTGHVPGCAEKAVAVAYYFVHVLGLPISSEK